MKNLITCCLLLASTLVFADPIKIIVPYAPGGINDRISRFVQFALNDDGFKTTLEYKLGAGGFIAYNFVAKAHKETVIIAASNGLTDGVDVGIAEYKLNDFTVVKHLGTMPAFVLVSGNHKAKTFQELTKQNRVTYGSSGVGSGTHISAAIVGSTFGNFVHVPYKGQIQALADVLAERIDFLMESPIFADDYIKSGKLRPLALLAPQRLKEYHNVPTLKELGVTDYGYSRWFILVANKDADPKDIEKIQRKLNSPKMINELEALGLYYEKTTPLVLQDLSDNFLKIRQNVKFE